MAVDIRLLRLKIKKALCLYDRSIPPEDDRSTPPEEGYNESFFSSAQRLIWKIKETSVPKKSEPKIIEATDDPLLKPLRDATIQENEKLKDALMRVYTTQKILANARVAGFIKEAEILQIDLPCADERYKPVMFVQLMSVSDSIFNYIAKLPQEIQSELFEKLDTFVDSIILKVPKIEAESEDSQSMPDETPNLDMGDSDSLINTLSELINQPRWDDKGSGFSGTFFGEPPHGIRNMRNILNNSRLDNNQKWEQIRQEACKRAEKKVSGRDPEVQYVYNIIAKAPSRLVFASLKANFLSQLQGLMPEQKPRQSSLRF